MTKTSPIRFVEIIRERIGNVVIGKKALTDRLLIALLAGGHVLLKGRPGLGKTLTVNALARAIGLHFGHVQLTRDLLPIDLVGAELPGQSGGEAQTKAGPIFSHVLLVDHLDHGTPKVQAALLAAMLERQVMIGSANYFLPSPFLVVATESASDQEAPLPLSEAQLDRFLFCHQVEAPDAGQEEEIVSRSLVLGLRSDENGAVPKTAFDLLNEPPVAKADELVDAMKAVQEVHVSEVLVKRAVELVRRTREHQMIATGAGPRASIDLTVAARARAFIEGRGHTIPDDLFALAEDVLAHRLRLKQDAMAGGNTPAAVLRGILTELG